jgi:molybdopterin synthase catalytic subunit
MAHFRLSDAPIDAVALQSGLRDPRAGACASFEGWVRDHNDGRAVDGLRYEAYVSLAEAEGAAILAEALERFDIVQATCVHRVGPRPQVASQAFAELVGQEHVVRALTNALDPAACTTPSCSPARAAWARPRSPASSPSR